MGPFVPDLIPDAVLYDGIFADGSIGDIEKRVALKQFYFFGIERGRSVHPHSADGHTSLLEIERIVYLKVERGRQQTRQTDPAHF